jgi:hypothetical protein
MTTATGSSIEHAIGAEGLLAIRLGGGEVRLRGIDGEIARVREVNDHDLGEMLVIDRGEGSLSLRAGRLLEIALGRLDGRRGVRHDAPELEIELPRRASVVIEAASCDVAAEGLVGDQRYRTASGDLTLRAATGRISVEAVSGDIDITATGSAEVIARTVSGDLALRAATLSSVVATTTSGDVRIAGRLSGAGPFSIDTVSGDALLAPAGDVRIEMSSVTGDLSSEFEGASVSRGRRSLEIGRSGPVVTFRSMSGDLRVVRPVPISEPAPAGQPIAADEDRLRILRSLERGEIDVAEAGRRLGALEAGEHQVDKDGPHA